jgi:hypothetical protein
LSQVQKEREFFWKFRNVWTLLQSPTLGT